MNKHEQTEIIEGAIRRSRFYRGGESFEASDFTGGNLPRKTGGDVTAKRIGQILHAMVLTGELEKTGPVNYRKAGGARPWLSKPWRSHSNAEIGVESMQFGVMA